MFKRLLLIGALCISLLGLSGTQATAYPPDLSGVNFCVWCSPCVTLTTEFVGIANVDLKPSDVYIEMSIEFMELFSVNPDGHPGGEGIPFWDYPVPLTAAQSTGENTPMTGRGKWEGIFQWDCDYIVQWIKDEGIIELPDLPNPHWSWKVIIHKALIRVIATNDINLQCEDLDSDFPPDPYYQCAVSLEDPEGEANFEEVVHSIHRCEVFYDEETGDPILGVPGWCEELFHWEFSSNKTESCTYPDPFVSKKPELYDCEYFFPPYEDGEFWWDTLP